MTTTASTFSFWLFLITVLTTSCRKDSDVLHTTLAKVEMCMDAHPDSALKLLNTISQPEDLQGKLQANYALLMTQAMDKNYMEFSSDSLIAVALNYFAENQSEPLMYAKAQFYYGRVMLELGKQEEGLKYFLAAKEIYETMQEYKMLALIAEEIGVINRQQEMYEDALKNFREALTIHKQLKDSLGAVMVSQNIARAYLYMNKWDSCAHYYNYALNIAEEKQYKSEISILHELGILYRSIGDLQKAEYFFLASFEKETVEDKKYKECLSLGYLYFQMRNLDNANKYLELAANSSNLLTKKDVYDCLFKIAKHQENYRIAIAYNEKADSVQTIMNRQNTQALIADLQKKYENEILQKENLQIKVHYTRFILFGTTAFMIALFFMCYYYYKNRNNKKRIADIEKEFRENEEEIAHYQEEIKGIYDSKNQQLKETHLKIGELNGKIMILSTQNKVLSEKLSNLGSEITVEAASGHYISAFRLLLAIKERTYRGKLSNEDREKILGLFDFLYLNYVSRLRERCSLLTKHDLEICCLLKIGLTNEELSHIFNTTSDSVTKAKGRLKGRLGVSSRDDLELFLRNF